MTNTTTTVRDITPGTDPAINGLIALQAWSSPITYAFPVNGSDYGTNYEGGLNTNNFQQISASQIIGAQFALDADVGPAASAGFSIEGFTMATISAGPGTTSTVRIGTSGALDFGEGFAFLPEDDPTAGDIWFHAPEVAQVGNYEWSTLLHEIGHAMGLEHAHEGTVVPAQFDHHAYTIMSYRSFQGGSTEGGSTSGTFGFPQTFMMYDIAALQYMYGANYTINNTDTVYSWNPGSGDTLVNGSIGVDAIDPTIFATIWDGGGIDTYDLSAFSTNLTLNLTAGGNSLFNTAQLADLGPGQVPDGNIYNALLFEGNTNSLIENAIGGSGNDTITGNEVSNVLTGNGGNDILDGGAGIDYVAYNGVQANYTITSNANGSYTIVGEGTDTVTNAEFARFTDGDVALAPSSGGEINGTESNDNALTGTTGDDIINGLGGNDVISGLAGNDTLNGGDGADRLIGGEGADILNGGAGFDSADYRSATTRVAFNVISGGTIGDANGDSFSGLERYYLSNFNDTITGSDANEFFYGEDGNDTINAGGGIDRVYGGDGDDIQRGQGGNDQLYGSAGADQLNGGTGFDIANYRAASSTIIVNLATGGTGGDADGDTYFGLEAIYGSDFNDRMTGNSSTNELRGFDGDDVLDGAGGNDRLFGGNGADSLIGGAGLDIAMYTVATAGVTLDLATGGTGGEAAGDTFTDIEWVFGSDFNDDITGDSGANRLTGNDGNDTLNGAGGNDRLLGGNGNDTINGGDGVDTIFGQTGDDIMTGGAGNDFFFGDSGADSHDGGTGTDTVSYLASSTGVTVNMQTGGTGGDAMGDTYTNIERIFGSSHDDSLTGSDGDDILIGNGGNDFLTGGLGNDSLNGGAGVDSFGYDEVVDEADVISGFTLNEVIYIFGSTVTDFTSLQTLGNDAGSNVIFDFGGGNTLTIVGHNLADLNAANFNFSGTPPAAQPLADPYDFAADITDVFDMYALM